MYVPPTTTIKLQSKAVDFMVVILILKRAMTAK